MNPDDRVLSPEELRAGVAGCDAVLCLLTDRIDAAVLEAAGGAASSPTWPSATTTSTWRRPGGWASW